jgi:hypothetical protein
MNRGYPPEPCDIAEMPKPLTAYSGSGKLDMDQYASQNSTRMNRFLSYYRQGNSTDPVRFPQVLTEARWEEEYHKFCDLELSREG